MNRYRTYTPLDDAPEIVGDAAFTALDMLTDPAAVAPGGLVRSENMRFDVNGTGVRKGIARMLPVGTSFGTILHANVYKPEGDDDNIAMVTAHGLALFRTANQTVTVFPFPGGETVDASANLGSVQAGLGTGTLPAFRMLRGLAKTVLVYDGVSVSVDSHTPPSEIVLYVQDRNVVNNTTQSLAVSDFDDFTNYNLLNQFKILKGSDDFLTGLLAYQKDYVLIGMRKKWFVAFFDPQTTAAAGAGYQAGLQADTSFLRELTREAGPVGPRAMIQALGKVWFITDGAIYAFTPQLDNELTVLGKPISAEIQPIMENMSAANARGAWIERFGYRLYFGLPINDDSVGIVGITITTTPGFGLALPFTIPALLGPGSLAVVETDEPHGLSVGDNSFISGATTPELNGTHVVVSVTDATHYIIATTAGTDAVVGGNATSQKIATRNNRIAVYNLNNDAWESVDTLPTGIFADFAVSADFGTRRRLWLVDANYGPVLYEENEADDIGTIVGGVTLPFTLPVILTAGNYAQAPVPGRFTTRSFRWGYAGTLSGGYSGRMDTTGVPRKVRSCEVRATLDDSTAISLSLLVRTPNNTVWNGQRDFVRSQFKTADAPLRKHCGARGLEGSVDVTVTTGRPVFRSVMLETAAVGRVEE